MTDVAVVHVETKKTDFVEPNGDSAMIEAEGESHDPLAEFITPVAAVKADEGNLETTLRGDDTEVITSGKVDFDDNDWDDAESDEDEGIIIITDGGTGENGTKRRGYERGANSYVRPEIPKDVVKATANLGSPGGIAAEITASTDTEPGAEDPLKALRFPYAGVYPRTAFDVDLTTVDSSVPWRQPRVDLSNYFNYGLTESRWKAYAEKQLRIRAERGEGPQSLVPPAAADETSGDSASPAPAISAAAIVASIHAATATTATATAATGAAARAPQAARTAEIKLRPIPPPVHMGTLTPYPNASPFGTPMSMPPHISGGAMPTFNPSAGGPSGARLGQSQGQGGQYGPGPGLGSGLPGFQPPRGHPSSIMAPMNTNTQMNMQMQPGGMNMQQQQQMQMQQQMYMHHMQQMQQQQMQQQQHSNMRGPPGQQTQGQGQGQGQGGYQHQGQQGQGQGGYQNNSRKRPFN